MSSLKEQLAHTVIRILNLAADGHHQRDAHLYSCSTIRRFPFGGR